ncbi:hypothetical protein K239x_46440 [Planctomycetes bacterium K23_9]|uniref:Uncharacterized protein n=1 Tax=Stieleria marina TaxID=1930275 RepID=A0A517NZU1_9BACT|nr:hypothetical protein K239x_46440 [Planctomycetes bacterium K23_9]
MQSRSDLKNRLAHSRMACWDWLPLSESVSAHDTPQSLPKTLCFPYSYNQTKLIESKWMQAGESGQILRAFASGRETRAGRTSLGAKWLN